MGRGGRGVVRLSGARSGQRRGQDRACRKELGTGGHGGRRQRSLEKRPRDFQSASAEASPACACTTAATSRVLRASGAELGFGVGTGSGLKCAAGWEALRRVLMVRRASPVPSRTSITDAWIAHDRRYAYSGAAFSPQSFSGAAPVCYRPQEKRAAKTRPDAGMQRWDLRLAVQDIEIGVCELRQPAVPH